jgi:hypothetical protein
LHVVERNGKLIGGLMTDRLQQEAAMLDLAGRTRYGPRAAGLLQ